MISRLICWLWLGQVMTIGMMEMSAPFWPLILREIHPLADDQLQFWSALIYLLPLGGAMITAPFWGRIGDCYGHKVMLLRTVVVLGLSQWAIFLTSDLKMLAMIRFAQGLFAGSIASAQAYALRMAPEDTHKRVLGCLMSAVAVGGLLGPLLGGFVAEHMGYSALFLWSSFASIIIVLMLLVLPNDTGLPRIAIREQKAEVSAGTVYYAVPVILLAIILAQVARRMPNTFFALYAESYLHASEVMMGILYAGTGVGVLIFAPLWGKFFDNAQEDAVVRYLPGICMAAALTLILQANIETSQWGCFLVRVLWGVWLAAFLPLFFSQLKQGAQPDLLGHIIGVGHRFSKVGGAIGIAVGAIVTAWFSLQWGFLTAAVIYLMMALLLWKERDRNA